MPNDLSAFIPERWARRIIANINQVNVALAVMCNTDYEGEVTNAGDTVWVRTFGSITMSTYTRNLPLVPQALAPTVESLLIDTSEYFAFDVDDLDRVQNDINALIGYTDRAGIAISNYIDTFVMAQCANALTANKIGTPAAPIAMTANTAGSTVYENLVKAGLRLDTQNVPPGGRWIIVTPFVKSLLMLNTTYFIRASLLGDAIVTSSNLGAADASRIGFIGQAAGFDVYVSNNPNTNGTYWACPFGQGKPVSYACQIPPSTLEVMRLETTFATRVRGLLLHGIKVFAEPSKKLGVLYSTNA